MTPWLSRSDLASRYYHEKVFDGATFADLREAGGPRIHINATDLSSGERFTFTQDTFDLICSDIDVLPIATAVAASSAVPDAALAHHAEELRGHLRLRATAVGRGGAEGTDTDPRRNARRAEFPRGSGTRS